MSAATASGLGPDYPPLPPALPAHVADSHCHLDLGSDGEAAAEANSPAVAEAVAAAAKVGVSAIIQVGCDLPGSRRAVAIAEAYEHVWATVALHPNEAPRLYGSQGRAGLVAAWTELDELASRPAVRGVGETGMDFYRTGPDGRVVQEESFRRHIDIAKNHGKALVVHDRDAHDDVLRILDDEGAPPVVVLHCFSGDAAFARQAVERGFYCSFAGVVTFKNAQPIRDALAEVPAELLLVETDAPFLTPVPCRGKPNASYLVPHTVRAIAEYRNWDTTDTCELLMANSERAFGAL
ncbi:MAG: TatD family hydrolase [Actinobacteria bacterium]|nr:TatD family hydrolase [Actinomycetota bacterium]MCB9412154.1 TatD family hydrolase [Actinomycetota bacterium]